MEPGRHDSLSDQSLLVAASLVLTPCHLALDSEVSEFGAISGYKTSLIFEKQCWFSRKLPWFTLTNFDLKFPNLNMSFDIVNFTFDNDYQYRNQSGPEIKLIMLVLARLLAVLILVDHLDGQQQYRAFYS